MIAPTARGCKRAVAGASILAPGRWSRAPPVSRKPCEIAHPGRHGIVSGIIIRPHFRQATAPLDCDNIILRWPGPFGSGFLSPQPPGVVRIGPVQQLDYSYPGPTRVGPFCFLGGAVAIGLARSAVAHGGRAIPRLGSKTSEPGIHNHDWANDIAELGSTPVGASWNGKKPKAGTQCSEVKAAPSIAPGLSRLPS